MALPFPTNITSLLLLLLCSLFLTNVRISAFLIGKRGHDHSTGRRPTPDPGQISCNIFAGSWVREASYPLYQPSSCSVVDPQFNCRLYGRPDADYMRFRWKPTACELPRFDGRDFLRRMRGKTVMFVGDSLGRNQWESLICMLTAAVPMSQTQYIKGDPISTLNFLEFGTSVSFHRAPYLVDIDTSEGRRILRLDDISTNSIPWRTADVLSFNSGHWWTHRGEMQGWDYMRDGEGLYVDMDRLVAFQKGLSTWARWVDANIDSSKTTVFFQSISPTHYNPTEWSDPVSKNCYGETTPATRYWNLSSAYPGQTRVLQGVIRAMRTPAYLLDITALSQLRKDAHPSIYTGELSPEQRANPTASSDCSHWCLPGLPDTWNQLLYTQLFFY